jgi:hypothetical protein
VSLPLLALYTTFFSRWVLTPIPIEICYGLLSNAKDTNTFSLCVCVQGVSPSRQCNYALPSNPTLLFSFRAQRVSAMWMILTRFLCVFVCRRWVHPVSVTMRPPPIPLFCFISVPSVSQQRLPFCDMKLTLFCVSTTSGLLHDIFQDVSVHPHPNWNVLRIAQRRLPFFDMELTLFCVCIPLLAFYTTFFSGW